MAAPSSRLASRVRRDFDAAAGARVLTVLREVPEGLSGASRLHPERIQSALVLGSGGDPDVVTARLVLARSDWRDALVAGGLADAGWRATLDRELGPGTVRTVRRPLRGRGAGRVRGVVALVLSVLLATSAVALAVGGEIALFRGRWVLAVLCYAGAALVIAALARGRRRFPSRRVPLRPPSWDR